MAHAVTCHQAKGGDPTTDNYVAHSLRADGFDASEDGTGRGTPLVSVVNALTERPDRGGGNSEGQRLVPVVAPVLTSNYGKQPDNSDTSAGPMLIAFTSKDHGADAGEVAPTLRSMGHDKSHANGGGQVAVAFDTSGYGASVNEETAPTLQASAARLSNQVQGVFTPMAVRRLTPRECERLQGFPDDYTLVTYRKKSAVDGPRYKALGNSMAVNVMRWIGCRIAAVERITSQRATDAA